MHDAGGVVVPVGRVDPDGEHAEHLVGCGGEHQGFVAVTGPGDPGGGEHPGRGRGGVDHPAERAGGVVVAQQDRAGGGVEAAGVEHDAGAVGDVAGNFPRHGDPGDSP